LSRCRWDQIIIHGRHGSRSCHVFFFISLAGAAVAPQLVGQPMQYCLFCINYLFRILKLSLGKKRVISIDRLIDWLGG
jgi:hypothetical protein